MFRILDWLIILMLSPFLLTIYILCIMALFITQGLPIHFCQERVGKSENSFKLYKFRSMIVDASMRGSYRTSNNDSRITRIGRFFRLTSLDELPQFINVMRGEMSIVGPRPYVAAQKNDYEEVLWKERHSVLPGITGLAQVSGRSNSPVKERLIHDLYYVRNRSLYLNLKILFLTLLIVVRRKGSN